MKMIALALIACLTVLSVSLPACPEDAAPAEPAASPAPIPGRLRVEVLSQLGKPIPEARVVFYRQPGPDEEPLDPCGTWEEIVPAAAAPGVFEEEVRPGTYRVEAGGGEWIGAVEEKVEVNSGETGRVKFSLEPGLVVSGRVTDEEGNPLPDVEVSYHLMGTQAVTRLRSRDKEVFSDPSGWFAFRDLSPAAYNLKLSRSGYVPVRVNNVAAGTSGLEVKMKRGFTIRGRLEGDLEDLGPSVFLKLSSGKWETDYRRVDLEPDNSFVIDDLERKSYTVVVRNRNYISRPAAPVAALPPEEARPIVIRVFTGGSLSGRVTETGSGAPLPGAYLQLIPPGSKRGEFSISDAPGEFSFEGLEGGEYTLEARLWLDEYGSSRLKRTVPIEPGEEISGFNLALEAGRRLAFSGTVLDAKGVPVEGAEVRLGFLAPGERTSWQGFRETVRSDAAGEFSHSVFLPGEGEVSLKATREDYAPAERKVELSPERSSVSGITLVLDHGSTLEVQVGKEEGGRSAVPGAVVTLRTDYRGKTGFRSSVQLKKITDSLGRCRFENLAPGAYRIEVAKSGYVPAKEKVSLEEAEPVRSFSLVLEPGRNLLVRVEDERGEAVEGAAVSAGERSSGFHFSFGPGQKENRTDSSGTCLLRELPAAPLSLSVIADGYVRINHHRVGADQDQVTVVMKAAGSIRGRFLTDRDRPMADLDILARKRSAGPLDLESGFLDTEGLGDGVFRVGRLAPGVYDLTVRAEGRAGRKIEAVEVEAGRAADLGEIVLGPESAISGRVRDEDGSPLKDAWVRIVDGEEGMISLFAGTGRSDPDGSFTIAGLSPGTLTLTVTAKNYRPEKIPGLTVGTGEVEEIPDIRLSRLTETEKEQLQRKKNLIPSLGVRIAEPEAAENTSMPESLVIEEVLPGTAAESSGLAAGDEIIKINGNSPAEAPMEFFQGLMAPSGTEIKITVKRAGDGREEELDLTVDQWSMEDLIRQTTQVD